MPKKRWKYDFIRHPKIFQELRANQDKYDNLIRSKRRFKKLYNYRDKYIIKIKSWKTKGRNNQYTGIIDYFYYVKKVLRFDHL